MLALASFLLFAGPSPARILDKCVAAHRALNAAQVSIDAVTRGQGQSFHNRFVLSYRRPNRLLLEVHALKTSSQPASDRTYSVVGSRLTALDSEADEYLTRDTNAKGDLYARASALLGSLDDSVRLALSPDVLQGFLKDFKKLSGWTERSGKTGVALSHTTLRNAAASTVAIVLGRDDLLRSFKIYGKGTLLSWTYAYRSGSRVASLSIPPGAHKVSSFLAPPPMPHFLNASAESIWRASIRAYARLKEVSMVVADPDGPVVVAISGHRAMQSEQGLMWTFDGKTLTIAKNGKVLREQAASSQIPSKVGPDLEPFLRSWATGQNVARSLAASDTVVRQAGVVYVKNVPCDVLELRSPGLKISVLVRRPDHLFARISSENLDASGARVASLDRIFDYKTIGKPLPAGLFKTTQAP